MRTQIIAASLLALLYAGLTSGFSFNVDATTEECFYEDVQVGQTIGIMFQVTQGGFLDIDIQLKAPDGRIVYNAEKQTEGKYSFVAHVDGEYSFCFSNRMSTLTPKVVSFIATLGDEPQQPKGPRPADLDPLDQAVQTLAEGIRAMEGDQEYMKMRERVHRNTNESTNSRVIWWSFFEVAALTALSLWEIYYVKRLFEIKRVGV
eukprot:TRINITY_DN6997_c0_g2_i1.p2 TRINITY_DN6997_c0_g2~~TRINITY_DN6997_c0_g2_i1.p2  ORF type:complete len:204 (+),score=59.51 TRINITY_DN6997_c0_g2_i1:155-766(+)